jgi:hypothetical protein
MSIPNLTWNYRPHTTHSVLRSRIRDFARTLFKGVAGTTIDGSQAIVTFFADRTAIYFNLVSERHVTVNVAPSRVSDAGRLCGALVGSKLMETIHERESQVRKVERNFEPAVDVLRRFMCQPDFQEHIIVLDEALAGAEESPFENDGPLARYLANLVAYAKLRRDPANVRYSADYLAKKAGLTHYGDNIGLTAKQKYAEDYTAVHQGRPRIFAPHVTIGKGLSPRTSLSIHFDWDPVAQKLILARFGRHGRGA